MAVRIKVPVEYTPVMLQKSVMEKFAPLFVILVVLMAFGLGSLWTQVRYLEKGGSPSAGAAAGTQPAAGGKYAKLSDAFKAMAKTAGLDGNKLVTCVDSGSKAAAVEADYQEGVKLGVQGTPAFYINGKFLGGAFPFASFKEIIDRELDGTGSKKYADYKDTNLTGAGAGTQPAFIAEPVSVSVGNAAVRGADSAKVTIVEFSDFQCPYCNQAYGTLKQVFSTYGDKVKLVYKNFPLREIHPLAEKSAEAWECAKDQSVDKAWKFHDAMFDAQQDWSGAAI